MLQVKVLVDGRANGTVTDGVPNVSFSLDSDVPGEALDSAIVTCADWKAQTTDQLNNPVRASLEPWTDYQVCVSTRGTSGETADGSATFRTGRLATPWQARWIGDSTLEVPEKTTPVPLTFRHRVALAAKLVRRAWVEATALGIYELQLDGAKVGDQLFAPGYTSYTHQVQYQTYDVTDLVHNGSELVVFLAAGWAVGSFTYGRKNRAYSDTPALLLELHVEYADGSCDVLATDETWDVTQEGPYRAAEFYDGETFDATVDLATVAWHKACVVAPRKEPQILAEYGEPVRAFTPLAPVDVRQAPSGEWVYDFGQNMAGVVRAQIRGANAGQVVTFRHAEVTVEGELFVKSLRTAKATATYVCAAGDQTYQPRLTYMGFRYVGVTGVDPADLTLEAVPLHSDFPQTGDFACSNRLINRLNENIRWGGFSNFVDIPTDCPQRDEREGWTGDTAVFSRTACFNFDMSRFYGKWLLDMKAEQGRGGGIPMVVPRGGDNWPVMANSCWGDSCILVPWALWLSRGDKSLLERQYPVMLRFLKAASWWSAFLSLTPTGRHVWRWPFHFGDWCAPGEDIKAWMGKGKWVATAYHANSLEIVAQVAGILGKPKDAARLRAERDQVVAAYRRAFTNGHGRLTKKEFQTGYVLPIHFGMTEGEESEAMAQNLERLLRQNGDKLSTGFTGTPYLLFALSDTGHVDEAYRVLLQTECPSWLYEVKAGGTTIWERWDALNPDGTVNMGQLTDNENDAGMVSFNHYANGAVGDWLYRRLLGLEPTEGGYRRFSVRPVPGGGITWARGYQDTPYGRAQVAWTCEDGTFSIDVMVPVSCACDVTLPDGQTAVLTSGRHHLECAFVAAAGEE